MKDRAFIIITLVIIAVIAIVTIVRAFIHPSVQLQNASQAPVVGTAQLGHTAPDFTIPTTSGIFALAKQTRPVFLEVFASWCPHCQRETAVLNKLYTTYKSRVAFLAIPGNGTGMDGSSPESEADLFAFQQRFNVLYPIAVFDPQLTVANEYIQGGYPTIAVIGRNKKILYLTSGEASYTQLSSALESALRHS